MEAAEDLVARAGALFAAGRVAESLAMHERALALGIDPLDTGGEVWRCAMLLGDFERAWRVSDTVIRRTRPQDFDRADLPRHRRLVWDGAPLNGRRVLVRCYHGLGDIIQFARLLPRVAALARSLRVQAPVALHGLLATLVGEGVLLPLETPEPEPAFDVAVELMEVPHALRLTLTGIPARVPYLGVDARRVETLRRRLRRRGRPLVGIAWAAGAWDGGHRSLPPASLEPLAAVPGTDWVCLQRGPALAADCGGLSFVDGVPRTDSLLDAAALIRCLDLVVSVDTVVAHLAGALAAPVWTLLAASADWRWLLDRSDTPWYPTMRLFRQPAAGDWETPISDIVGKISTSLNISIKL